MNLKDIFKKPIPKRLLNEFGVRTVREAQALTDIQLRSVYGFGPMKIQKLRNQITVNYDQKIPKRMWCAMCNQPHKIDFKVKQEVWEEVIHPSHHHSLICLSCFTNRADEKMIKWEEAITILAMTSMATQHEIQIFSTKQKQK